VHHEVYIVEQDPLGLAVTFDVGRSHARGLQAQFDLICDGLYLPGIGPVAQHEVVGKGSRPFFHFEDGKLFGFLFEAGLNGGVYLLFEIILLHAVVGRWCFAWLSEL